MTRSASVLKILSNSSSVMGKSASNNKTLWKLLSLIPLFIAPPLPSLLSLIRSFTGNFLTTSGVLSCPSNTTTISALGSVDDIFSNVLPILLSSLNAGMIIEINLTS
ncbi:hypothetical protein YG5714_3049 [Sulfolobus islandicus Y.G.57.14]|uniref:Uncharacterized protein n=1 Tax=Saccharolobus islandicus (strain Y.G.57.14 / Yellowstone \|nr:hypothetical protein YG5714_3049 [Sulfolobus islandicus Y.G.57.14]